MFTTQPVDYHEIVHALTRNWGSPPALFKEGLAEAIGCGTLAGDRSVEPTDQVLLWFSDDSFYSGTRDEIFARYPIAQSFVFFLIERFGIERVSSLYRSIRSGEPLERLDAAFAARLGGGLYEVVNDWVESGERPLRRVCYPVPLCTAADISEDGGAIQLTCGPGVDPVLDQYGSVRSFAVATDRATVLRMSSAAETGWMDVSGCASSLPRMTTIDDNLRRAYAEVGVDIVGDRVIVAELAPGDYYATFRTTATNDGTETEATVTRGAVTVGGRCGEATTLDLDSDMGEVSLYIRGSGVRWIGVRGATDLYLSVVLPHTEEGVRQVSRVESCTSCGGECSEIIGMEPVHIAAGETVMLALYPGCEEASCWAILLPTAVPR